MAYLLKSQEIYRVEDEAAAKQLIEDAKNDGAGDLVKYSSEYHERKSKGEVIDSWYRVTLNRAFSDEKEPEGYYSVSYEGGSF